MAQPIPTWYVDPDAEAQMADGHAPIWRHIIKLMPEHDLSTKTVLDFGCNQGGFLRHLYALRPFYKALGVDIAEQSVARANELKGSMPIQYQTNVGLAGWDAQFDIALSHEVVYLIEDLTSHAHDIWRVLKSGGVYYVVTGCHSDNPMWPRWRELVAQRTHTVVYDRSITDYAQEFLSAGFRVTAKKLGFDGFLPYAPEGWMPDLCDTLNYFTETKIIFRLIKP